MGSRRGAKGGIILIVAAFLTLTPSPTFAWNPFKAAGDALGSVARGVGNIFGQGIAGLASPTINAFSDDMNKVLAERITQIDKVMEARLTQVDNILSTRINQVDTVIGKSLSEFDKTLTNNINLFDELMDQKIGAFDIVTTKAVQAAEDSMVSVVRFTAIIFLIAGGIFVTGKFLISNYQKTGFRAGWSETLVAGIGTVAGSAVLVLVSSYLVSPPAGGRVNRMLVDFKEATLTAYNYGELNDAATYAKQLTVLDQSSVEFAAIQKVTELQRDILYRPTVLKSAEGANELLPRLRRLDMFVQDDKFKSSKDPFVEFVKRQISATSAVALWQLAQNRATENVALCNATDALMRLNQEVTGKSERSIKENIMATATPFDWLAYSYVKWSSAVAQGSYSAIECTGTDRGILQPQLASLKELIIGFDSADPPQQIAQIVQFNRAATRYFVEASPLYMAMIMQEAAASVPTQASFKLQHIQARNELADRLINLWTNFANQAIEQGWSKTDIGLAVVGMPAALAVRAQLTRYVADPAARTLAGATCTDTSNSLGNAAKFNNLKPDPAGPLVQVDTIYSLLRIYGSSTLRPAICNDQLAFDGALKAFEMKIYQAVRGDGVEEEAGRIAAMNSDIIAGLTVCQPNSDENFGWAAHPICTKKAFEKVRDPWEIKTIPASDPNSVWLKWIDPGNPPQLPNDDRKRARYAMVR